MKTFVEDFEYFKKELSYEKLFLEGMISVQIPVILTTQFQFKVTT